MADELSGYYDLSYSWFDSETITAGGDVTSMDIDGVQQQYGLTLNKRLFPNLRLLAGGIFEAKRVITEIDQEERTTRSTVSRPYFDLLLKDPVFLLGASYSKRELRDVFAGAQTAKDITKEYTGLIGWRPEGLPSVDLRMRSTDIYDKPRVLRNTTEDFVSMTALYEPVRQVLLRYQGAARETRDILNDLEVNVRTHAGKAVYDAQFFDRRVSLYTSYDIARRETITEASGTGDVSFPVFLLEGLFALDSTPLDGALGPAPFLIDADTAGIGGGIVNIGSGPFTRGDLTPRNIGLRFDTITGVNILSLWVDRDLPAAVSGAFSWDIFVSRDGVQWSGPQLGVTASYSTVGGSHFELSLPAAATHYIKVVVRPIPPIGEAALFPDIYVTELEASIRRPAADVRGETVTTTRISNLNLRTRLLDTPYLYYDISYYSLLTEGIATVRRSTVTDGLGVSHRFSDALFGSARAARENSTEPTGDVHAYLYTATVRATPLETLSHSLTYSGRDERTQDGENRRNSVVLSNTAELYKGIDLLLNGGFGFSTLALDKKERSTLFLVGATVTPHPALTLTPNFSSTESQSWGGTAPRITSVTRTADVTAAYAPFRTLYLTAYRSRVAQNAVRRSIRNYGVTWSPFPDGALQVSVPYNENLLSDNDTVDKTLRPFVRWNINRWMYLDVFYVSHKSLSTVQETKSTGYGTEFRWHF